MVAGNSSCLVHLPCSHGGTGGPMDADGPCFCCDLAVNTQQARRVRTFPLSVSSHMTGMPSGHHASMCAGCCALRLPTAVIWLLVISSLILPVSLRCRDVLHCSEHHCLW